MKMHQRESECQIVKVPTHFVFLIFLIIFYCSLFTVHYSLSFADSLSDIKIAELQAPVKEKWGRDPFLRYDDLTSKKVPKKEILFFDLKIDGIISDGKKALAIINGGFYRKNERVNDFLIADIGRDNILLEKDGKRFSVGIKKFAIESTFKGRGKR